MKQEEQNWDCQDHEYDTYDRCMKCNFVKSGSKWEKEEDTERAKEDLKEMRDCLLRGKGIAPLFDSTKYEWGKTFTTALACMDEVETLRGEHTTSYLMGSEDTKKGFKKEISRLKQAATMREELLDKVMSERDRLKGEVERLKKAIKVAFNYDGREGDYIVKVEKYTELESKYYKLQATLSAIRGIGVEGWIRVLVDYCAVGKDYKVTILERGLAAAIVAKLKEVG